MTSREAFEAWVKQGKNFDLKFDGVGEYLIHETRMHWVGWQAAWTARGKHDAEVRRKIEKDIWNGEEARAAETCAQAIEGEE